MRVWRSETQYLTTRKLIPSGKIVTLTPTGKRSLNLQFPRFILTSIFAVFSTCICTYFVSRWVLEAPPSQERCAIRKSQVSLSRSYVVNIMIFQPFLLQHTQKLIKLHNFLMQLSRRFLYLFIIFNQVGQPNQSSQGRKSVREKSTFLCKFSFRAKTARKS